MDLMIEKKLECKEEGYRGPQKMQDYGGESISALVKDEMIDEDDEYDELYGDVNIGPSFQFQLSEAPCPSANDAVNVVIDDEDYEYEELYSDINIKEGSLHLELSEVPGLSTNGVVSTGIDPFDILGKVGSESVPLLNPNTSVQCAIPQMPPNPSNDNMNLNHQISKDKSIRQSEESGATMLFVGELHWWTTDAEIESVSSKYGTVKEIKFFDEKATGKSKGCCRVEFYDSAAAAACKKGMNGYNFNGRACTVKFTSPHTSWKMADSYMNKFRVQPQSQSHANPSNFGKGMCASGMGMMGSARMDGSHSGMWNDTNMGKWGAEEHDKRPRESSYGGKEGGYGCRYVESSHDKFSKSYIISHEKERASERECDMLDNSNKRHRNKREHGRERYVRERYERERYDREMYNRERYDRKHRYREKRDDYHIHRRDFDYKDDWDRGQASSRYRSRSRVMEVDRRRSRSRDAGYGKRSAYRR